MPRLELDELEFCAAVELEDELDEFVIAVELDEELDEMSAGTGAGRPSLFSVTTIMPAVAVLA